jgi:hypothetical protein
MNGPLDRHPGFTNVWIAGGGPSWPDRTAGSVGLVPRRVKSTQKLTAAFVFKGHGHPRAERLDLALLELQVQTAHFGNA